MSSPVLHADYECPSAASHHSRSGIPLQRIHRKQPLPHRGLQPAMLMPRPSRWWHQHQGTPGQRAQRRPWLVGIACRSSLIVSMYFDTEPDVERLLDDAYRAITPDKYVFYDPSMGLTRETIVGLIRQCLSGKIS